MKKTNLLLCASLGIVLMTACTSATPDRERSLNDGWRFTAEAVSGAEAADYDDSGWTAIDLPHDFSILPLPGDDTDDKIGPFSKASPGGNFSGHVMDGTGWYRRTLTVGPEDAGKRMTLVIDGAFQETDVWVNGTHIGENKHGYTAFAFDITDALRPIGEENSIAIRVANIGQTARWYSGSGLYRDVTLLVTDPLHVDVWGVYVTTPQVDADQATVSVEVTLCNDRTSAADAEVGIRLLDPAGKVVATQCAEVAVETSDKGIVTQTLTVDNPALWGLDAPNLYQAEITVKRDGQVVDACIQRFGIRTLEFTSDRGLLLNGQPVILRGGCLHHDNGFLGSKAIRRAEYRRVGILKANGYNAIRSSHNPPSTHLLNACDELGMLVIDEAFDVWTFHKAKDDYSTFFKENWEKDLTNMLKRDRNHPSIILWSIGNEIINVNPAEGLSYGQQLRDKVKSLDTTRPVTQAVPNFLLPGGWAGSAPFFALLDVCGYNYTQRFYAQDHEQYPDRIMYGSETYPGQAYENWYAAENYPYVLGGFVWTAMDYIGEVAVGNSTYVKEIPYSPVDPFSDLYQLTPELMKKMSERVTVSTWPMFVAWCGDIDITGEKKPQALYLDVLWDKSVVEMNVHEPIPEGLVEHVTEWGWPHEYPSWTWNGCEGQTLQVRAFTKAARVRLELNGQAVGEQMLTEADKFIATFSLPYQPGTLTAVALSADGQELGRKELVTASEPVSLRLAVDREVIANDRSDLAFIRIEAVDSQGRIVPTSDIRVDIAISGVGELAASGNANPSDMQSVNRTSVCLYRGLAQAVVRPLGGKGRISVRVSADALTAAEAVIRVE